MPAKPSPPGTKFCQGCANKGLDPHRPLDEFADKGHGRKQARCRVCHNEQMRGHYRKDHSTYKAKAIAKKRIEIAWYKEFKSTLICSRCPENDPCCLQFHHTDPSTKEVTLVMAIRKGWSRKKFLAEVAKCEVLCANCHFKEHHRLRLVPTQGVEPCLTDS